MNDTTDTGETGASLVEAAGEHLRLLCSPGSNRHVGGPGNRRATDYFADTLEVLGIPAERSCFDCDDWHDEGVTLVGGGQRFKAQASPYSAGCDISAPLVVATSVSELEGADLAGKILLLRGEIASEPLMPKNFPFYNPEEHRAIIRALEDAAPAAIVTAAAGRAPRAGESAPTPLIEDGDFEIPSVFLSEEEGSRLADCVGRRVTLEVRTSLTPSTACNLVGRFGAESQDKVVVVAHIDAKPGTPGALDNAGGIVTLLLLARLLRRHVGLPGVELVAINGEDHFANPGEVQFLKDSEGQFGRIMLGINLDGLGYCLGRTAYSLYHCPPALGSTIRQVFAEGGDFVEGEPWYQGDHSLFLLKQRPALAFTSERATELLDQVIHTPRDTPDLVDTAKLAATAVALQRLLAALPVHRGPGAGRKRAGQ